MRNRWNLVVLTLITALTLFSIFVVWLVKTVVMRLGGVSLFRAGQPFFIGMLSAHALGVLISFIVDYIWFPGAGHIVDDW